MLGLLLASSSALAQSTVPAADPAAYTGPRFPGGPDSLRAFVYRATRQAGPAPAGQMLVRFELRDGRQPQRFELLAPPRAVSRELKQAATAALAYLRAQMPVWEPGTPDPDDKSGDAPTISLLLDFTTAKAAQPYAYGDQQPVFPNFVSLLRAQNNPYHARLLQNPARLHDLESSPKGLARFIQIQVKYPPEALRNRQQGQVLAYFEVAETGAIEHPQIVGTAGQVLDAEVLPIVQQLPAATTSARLQGRPVRVYYVMPVNFKMM